MCIRDSLDPRRRGHVGVAPPGADAALDPGLDRGGVRPGICLLYTSDAADERSSVDLGGRRIIKKKKSQSL